MASRISTLVLGWNTRALQPFGTPAETDLKLFTINRRAVHQLNLVRQAKLQNLQNRLGFVLQTAGTETPELLAVVQELERARLLQESTLCWDSMPAATREWMRVNRPALAVRWNVVTTLRPEDSSHAG